jgi:hypothetical protein
MQYDVKVRVVADVVLRVDATSKDHAFDVAMEQADGLFSNHDKVWPGVVSSSIMDTEVLDTSVCD